MSFRGEKHARFRDARCLSFESNSSRRVFPIKKHSFKSMLSGTRSRGLGMSSGRLNFRRLPSYWPSQSDDKSKEILDPHGAFLETMNKVFIFSCLLALFVDPLFFYIPVLDTKKFCVSLDTKLKVVVCFLRSVNDLFYVYHIILQFRTGFVAPSSRVFGRGELVEDRKAIARRYITSYFLIDVWAVLPVPQTVFTLVMPSESISEIIKDISKYIMYWQYIPRLLRMYPLYKEVSRTSGKLTESTRLGAFSYLLIYMLASHTIGAMWYLFSVERMDKCWHDVRRTENPFCSLREPSEEYDNFNFGIFLGALKSHVAERTRFKTKLLFCFWWGLKQMSALGQNLDTSEFEGEILFAVSICVIGLVLFALLIGNMQKYLQSMTVREDEMRVKRRDIEQWMHHRMLPEHLRKRIRRYDQYKWQETRGVEEETLIRSLPKDLRRDVKQHLCWMLLKRVPMFGKMDGQLLDALCSYLRPVLYTENSIIVREGDPVDEMLFIMRGEMLSMTTNCSRTGFVNSVYLKPGDFCGEELLTWALDPHSTSSLPISTRTVQAKKDVEAFALSAQDLKLVASQFRRLHSKHIRHTFRFYSEQWRTWGACFIQAAWRRYRRRKIEWFMHADGHSCRLQDTFEKEGGSSPSIRSVVYASRFAANMLGTLKRNAKNTKTSLELVPQQLQKPKDPDFDADADVEKCL